MKKKTLDVKKDRFNLDTFRGARRDHGGQVCRTLEFFKTLSLREGESFLEALNDPTISVPAVQRVAKSFGSNISMDSLYSHRRDPGMCLQCKRAGIKPPKTKNPRPNE